MHTKQFLQILEESIGNGTFLKCTLSRPAKNAPEALKNVYLRPVEVKKQLKIAFNYRYQTKDEVKNFAPAEAVQLLQSMLGDSFGNADLFTTSGDYTLSYNKKGETQFQEKKATLTKPVSTVHNREKQRLLQPTAPWLHLLGIASAKGEILSSAQDKWRQINKYLETIAALLKESPLPENAFIADMGSGKGYLTFALYDYLCNHLGTPVQITGIELRQELVDFCNETATKVGFTNLKFIAQDINTYAPEQLDMLIALHACDIATDMAIARGIQRDSGIIVVAPCCHKQVRKAMKPQAPFSEMLKFGILAERQAEIATDAIRAMLLESKGYKTKVFEFISTEHTPKNVMITATRTGKPDGAAQQKVNDLKLSLGIREHYLEQLLGTT